MRWLGSWLVVLSAGVAQAQTFGGQFEVVCGTDCEPLNRASCDEPSDNIDIIVRRSSQSTIVLEGSELYVWLQSASGSNCTYDPAADANKVKLYEDGEPLLFDDPFVSSVDYVFPDDIASDESLTSTDLLGATNDMELLNVVSDACDEAGIEATYRLCFGIDAPDSLTFAPDGEVVSTEPWAFVEITVDTKPPPVPTLSVTAKDGRVEVTASVEDGDDVATYVARVRQAPDDAVASDEPSDCFTWESGTFTETESPSGGDSETFDVDAPNGQLTQGCVFTRDAADNRSATPSAAFLTTPIDQCDFMECYPGDLEPGHCGAVGAPSFIALALLLALCLGQRQRGARC